MRRTHVRLHQGGLLWPVCPVSGEEPAASSRSEEIGCEWQETGGNGGSHESDDAEALRHPQWVHAPKQFICVTRAASRQLATNMHAAIQDFEARLLRVTRGISSNFMQLPECVQSAEKKFGHHGIRTLSVSLERRLRTCKPNEKLACLYAIDVVMKHVQAYKDWVLPALQGYIEHAQAHGAPENKHKINKVESVWRRLVAQADDYDPSRPELAVRGFMTIAKDPRRRQVCFDGDALAELIRALGGAVA